MRKAGLTVRPISATGKETAGFTLLEILAVILLIGLICAVTYPNFVRSQEKVELRYVGELLKTDLQQVREEAMTHRTAQTVTLLGSAYHFKIGDLEIGRKLRRYNEFSFVTPTPIEEGQSVTEKAKTEPDPIVLIFAADGSCDAVTVNWESKHFRGSLVVNADGTSRWRF
jgi:prepilin-type N-terminal cleavage/methylation domain-containing protein